MDVTKQNFSEMLIKFEEILKTADFVAFDGEFTGLGLKCNKYSDLDTVQQRYTKAKNNVEEYGLLQTGFSIFTYVAKMKKYINNTFNFYLSGNQTKSYKYDASSMKFLADNNFDFNHLFKDGLSFISLFEEANIRQNKTKKKQMFDASKSPIKIKDNTFKKFLADVMRRVAEFKDCKGSQPLLFHGSELTSFHRKLIYNNVSVHEPNLHFHSCKEAEKSIEVLYFDTVEEKNKFLEDEWESWLYELIGFTHFIRKLMESGKPLVGHNMMLDLLHILHKFIQTLPESVDDAKMICRTNLPTIYDTKVIVSDPPFRSPICSTGLQSLYTDLIVNHNPPGITVETDSHGYTTNTTDDAGNPVHQAHNAGYDAFMTGVCFLTMGKVLNGKHWYKKSLLKQMEPYENKVNMMHSIDIPYIDLSKTQGLPDRSHILCVTCPPSWNAYDIKKLFKTLGYFNISWIDDTHFYIIPQEENTIKKVPTLLSAIKSISPPNVSIKLYTPPEEEYLKLKENYSNDKDGSGSTSMDLDNVDIGVPVDRSTPSDSKKCEINNKRKFESQTKDRSGSQINLTMDLDGSADSQCTNVSASVVGLQRVKWKTTDTRNLLSGMPSSVKLSSETVELTGNKHEDETSGAMDNTEAMVLKRIKSVGCDKLSGLSLESPSSELNPLTAQIAKEAVKDNDSGGTDKSTGGERFNVPDEW